MAVVSLSQLINFDYTYPRPTTVARQNSSVVSGSDCYKNRRLQVIRRRQSGCLNCRLLRVFPIIVRIEDIAVAIEQPKKGVCKNARDARLGEGWPEAAHQHLSTAVTSLGNKAPNHHVVTSANKTSS